MRLLTTQLYHFRPAIGTTDTTKDGAPESAALLRDTVNCVRVSWGNFLVALAPASGAHILPLLRLTLLMRLAKRRRRRLAGNQMRADQPIVRLFERLLSCARWVTHTGCRPLLIPLVSVSMQITYHAHSSCQVRTCSYLLARHDYALPREALLVSRKTAGTRGGGRGEHASPGPQLEKIFYPIDGSAIECYPSGHEQPRVSSWKPVAPSAGRARSASPPSVPP